MTLPGDYYIALMCKNPDAKIDPLSFREEMSWNDVVVIVRYDSGNFSMNTSF